MIWTHIFDLLAKLCGMVIIVMLAILGGPAKMELVSYALCFLAGGMVWWVVLRPLSSWLHARVRLGTWLSWGQARRASLLFSPVHVTMMWHPLWEVRGLPVELRAAAIEESVRQLQAVLEAEAARRRASPLASKVCRGLLWPAMAVVAVLTFGHVPPASWVSEAQARMFDGSYSRMLTFLVVVAPIAGVLTWLENRFNARSITVVNHSPQARAPEAAAPTDEAAGSAVKAVEGPQETKEQEPVDPEDHSRFMPPRG